MLHTPARLLRLLSMLQARRSWPGAELAEQLEVTDRTLRRDIDRLRSLGYPVHSTSGVAGGYSLGAGASLPPLMLDDDEGLAVFMGLKNAVGGSLSGIEDASLRALAKLERVLPARVRTRVQTLSASFVRLSDSGPRVELDTVSALAQACSDQLEIRFGYRDQQGNESQRHVEPHRVVHMERRWYLVAYDKGREDFRTFRLDRLILPFTQGAPFSPRAFPGGDITAYVKRSISGNGDCAQASIILHAPLEQVRPILSPSFGTPEAIDNTQCRLRLSDRNLEFLACWLGMLPVDFHVEEPSELRVHLAALSQRLARAAGE